MDQTHLHLIITHLPIYGSVLGCQVLIYGIYTRSTNTILAAYYLLIVSAIGGIIAYSTGESAEETVEGIQGITKGIIEEHEEFAELTLFSIIAMGLISTAGIFATLRRPLYLRKMAFVILGVSIICFSMTAWTGYLGGQIRHTELNSAKVMVNQESNSD